MRLRSSKSGLVYSKSLGQVIGYTDLGQITNELEQLNRRLSTQTDKTTEPSVATQMLVLMARGIFSNAIADG